MEEEAYRWARMLGTMGFMGKTSRLPRSPGKDHEKMIEAFFKKSLKIRKVPEVSLLRKTANEGFPHHRFLVLGTLNALAEGR